MRNLQLTTRSADEAGKIDRWAATFSRTVVLLLILWIVIHNGWPSNQLDKRVAELTLGNVVADLSGILSVVIFGLLILRSLMKLPPTSQRTKQWCLG